MCAVYAKVVWEGAHTCCSRRSADVGVGAQQQRLTGQPQQARAQQLGGTGSKGMERGGFKKGGVGVGWGREEVARGGGNNPMPSSWGQRGLPGGAW